jgi:hypothetical protein
MKSLIVAFALATLTLSSLPTPVAAQDNTNDSSRYGALAYSPKTGKYGYAWDQLTRTAAEELARAECKANDAKVLAWVRTGWAALVIAEDKSYGYDEVNGDGANSEAAYQKALKKLRNYSNAKVKTIIIVSGNVRPKVINK